MDKKRFNDVFMNLDKTKSKYDELGIPELYYNRNMKDLIFRAKRYLAKEGKFGLDQNDIKWSKDLLEAKMFDFGSLRFQIFPFSYTEFERSGYDYMPMSDEMKTRFVEGEYYLNIHIAKDVDLSKEMVQASLDEARVFFGRYFSELDFKGFVTRTWLIDPVLVSLVSSNSRIAQFASFFEIINRTENYVLPFDRIYGTHDFLKIKKMNHTSSLMKKAHLKKDELGVSFGFIPW